MNLSKTIKQCRKVKKMTQKDVAEKAGISVSHLSLLETNKREPSISVLEDIASALGVPLGVLIFLSVDQSKINEIKKEQLEALTHNIMDLIKDVSI